MGADMNHVSFLHQLQGIFRCCALEVADARRWIQRGDFSRFAPGFGQRRKPKLHAPGGVCQYERCAPGFSRFAAAKQREWGGEHHEPVSLDEEPSIGGVTESRKWSVPKRFIPHDEKSAAAYQEVRSVTHERFHVVDG